MTVELEKELKDLLRQNIELSSEVRILTRQLEDLSKRVDNFSSGINRGLWIIGGGFLSAMVLWITKGGLSSG